MTSKICKICGEDKPFSEYHKKSVEKDKLNIYCKVCSNKKSKEWKAQFPEKNKESAKKSNAKTRLKEGHKERHRVYCKKYREVNNANACKASREYRARKKAKLPTKPARHYDELLSHISRQRRYNLLRQRATPAWANKAAILIIYNKSRRLKAWMEEIYEVDHIVPIKSEFVCGLHCEANLRIVPFDQNRAKSNRHWPDMWTN